MHQQRSPEVYEIIAVILRAMADPLRLRLLEELREGPQKFGQLVEAVEQGNSSTSKHLKHLYEAGLVSRRRQATQIWYSLADNLAEEICQLISQKRKLEPPKKPQQSLLFDL